MNRLLLCALPLALCRVALAQPEERPAAPVAAPPIAQSTPVGAVRSFINDLQSQTLDQAREWRLAAAVDGARPGYYGGEEWVYAFSHLMRFDGVVDDVRLTSQLGDETTVLVASHVMETAANGPANQTKQQHDDTQTLRLHLEHNNVPGMGQNIWRIVPPPIDEVLAKPLYEAPPLLLAVALATHDPRLESAIRRERAESQLKMLALGVFQSVQDFDETFVFDDAGHERALQPYLKDDSLYTIAGTAGEKWRFNDHLAGLSLAKLNEVARTVLFYDGTAPQSDALKFRFDGKTVIGFADGHVAALSKDELKDLIWTP